MSDFKVTIEKVKQVEKHPNADRLDLVWLDSKNYQLITQKDQYKPKDKVVYFPVDSIMPQNLIDKMGLSYLHGANKDRVKTVKLRGSISQGIITKATDFKFGKLKPGVDVTEQLGVTKFNPEPNWTSKHTKLRNLPDGVFYYDIENAQNYPEVMEFFNNEMVYVEEKLEGTHYTLSYLPDTNEFDICSRRMKVEVDTITFYEDNPYWKVTYDNQYADQIKVLSDKLLRDGKPHNRITLRGELLGGKIQNNIYSNSAYDVYFFELELDSKPISRVLFFDLLAQVGLKTVPVLFTGYLRDFTQDIVITSNGYSVLKPTQLREGIVIRPFYETEIRGFGRAIIKQRSPEYLANSDL